MSRQHDTTRNTFVTARVQTLNRACVELLFDDSSSEELAGRPFFLHGCDPARVDNLTIPCLWINFLKRAVHAVSPHFHVLVQRVHSPMLRLRRTIVTRSTQRRCTR